MIKSIAMSACVATLMVVAVANANAWKGGDELFAAPTVDSQTSAPQPKDKSTTREETK